MRFLRYIDESKYRTTPGDFQYADWLSFEPMETCRDGYWTCRDPKILAWWAYLGGCYWRMDALKMAEMAEATQRAADASWCRDSAERAMAYLRSMLVDGRLPAGFRSLQSANLFALHLGVFTDEGRASEAKRILLDTIAARKNCLATGFLGTSILMDTLTELGEVETAYSILLNHGFPSWLYEVDQGATTVWERWNSYTKKDGFGPVDMNSFNHYAYGSVLGWLFSAAAGIQADPKRPGWRHFVLHPHPDRRLGSLKATLGSPKGRILSAWSYDVDGTLRWKFTIPEGTTATVVRPDGVTREYAGGTYEHSFGRLDKR